MSRYMFTNSNYDTESNEETYGKFLEFKEVFFNKGVSIFDNNLKLFEDNEVFVEFEKQIIINFDSSKKGSIEKYKKQLENASDKVRHFFVNVLWLYNFSIYDMKQKTKIREIKEYLGNASYSEELLNYMVPKNGIASYGSTRQAKYFSICFVYFFIKDFIKTNNEPIEIIKNLNLYKRMNSLSNLSFKKVKFVPPLHMLKYLYNPDFYEPVVNTDGKKNIVMHYLKEVNEETLDEDLFKIRENGFGFENSLYATLYGEEALGKSNKKYKQASLDKFKKNIKNKFEFSLTSNNYETKEDLLGTERTKLENGEKAEELVYKDILNSLTFTEKTDLKNLIKEYYKINSILRLQENIDKFIHYSKNIDRYAPFDLISISHGDILYIEVKSTINNQIYFSKSEIIFAYENLGNYEVKIVKNEEIYNIEISDLIKEVYFFIKNKSNDWECNNFIFKICFNE